MDIRDVEPDDTESVRSVAHRSLTESYDHFIEQRIIDEIVEKWYDDERIADLIAAENHVFLVASQDDTIVGFVQGALISDEPLIGEIDWLHVDPEHRGAGISLRLLGQIQEHFEDQSASIIRGKVLAQNETGVAFYENEGFERTKTRPVTIDDTEYQEAVYETTIGESADEEVVTTITGPAQEELVVSFSDAERGAKAPFYAVFLSEDLKERYGFFCGNCESIDTAMDAMGRIECNKCANKRKATRWDAAYL